jgi:hypothetical protein
MRGSGIWMLSCWLRRLREERDRMVVFEIVGNSKKFGGLE